MAASTEFFVYVGTYTRPNSKGIYAYRFNSTSGKLSPLGLATEANNASFLVGHPNNQYLYAVNEADSGSVAAYAIDTTSGKLTQINTVPSRGSGPCHLTIDNTGKWLFVANYNTGSVASFPVRSNGSLGEAAGFAQHSGSSLNPRRQAGPHAHSVNLSPDGQFLIVTDLGLDQILSYRFDAANGHLTPNNPAFTKLEPGSGPRHLAFSPDGQFAWVVNEMTATVTTLKYARATGTLTPIQTTSTLPPQFTGTKSAAEIAVHPKGRFLYTSNRGHDTIAIFDIDPGNGLIRPGRWVSTRGKTPRYFVLDPSATFLFAANQDSNSLAIYRLDATTGGLEAEGAILEAPVPVSVVFVPVP
jgi:6-phosphogluconolactonase